VEVDGAVLKARSNEILKTIINPVFLEKLTIIKELPKNNQMKVIANTLIPSSLEKAGIKTPKGIRFRSRYFEEAEEFDILHDDLKDEIAVGRFPVVPASILRARDQEPGFIDKLRESNPELYKQIVRYLRSVGGEVSYSMCLLAGIGTFVGIGSGRVQGAPARKPTSAAISRLDDECKRGYDGIIQFVTTPKFNSVYNELMDLPIYDRPKFVVNVLLNDIELQNRGVNRPDNLLILRSTFGDRSPILFCVKKWLPKDLLMFWENVNITFFNNDSEEKVLEGVSAWRLPVPVAIQHEYLSGRMSKEDVDTVVDSLELITQLGFK